ncbi:hypothetical protein NE237_010127 [Protea cynaroides]|uniref:Uncharacterized protein n=1 Tax=Protea cynaroides TaxID=273540 RepID=A0A9Q0R1A9_9MAGN|nr:hypothetical protein NE237_010127 [Protea cynaroides]
MEALLRKHVVVDPVCHRCGKETESIEHLLLYCLFARAVWFEIQQPTLSSPETWQPPPIVIFKLNTDAALSTDGSNSAIGMICRDAMGQVQFMAAMDIHFSSPTIGEALAIRFAIRLAMQHGYNSLLVESDNLGVIQALKDGGCLQDVWLHDLVRDLLREVDVMCTASFCYSPRTTNLVAHHVAKQASRGSGLMFWDQSSSWLMNLCKNDMMFFSANDQWMGILSNK